MTDKLLREALEWYASPAAWTMEQLEGAHGDYGARARAALAAAPQPVPATVPCCICFKPCVTAEDGGPECELRDGIWTRSRECYAKHPSVVEGDALLARGLRLPGGEETIAWAAKIILSQPKRPDSPVAEAFTVACAHLEDRECGAETTNEIIETFLKALAGEDN